MKPIISALLLLPLGVLLSGCVVGELRDEARTSNAHLCEANRQLADVQVGQAAAILQLADLRKEVATTNAQLTDMQSVLTATNSQLADVHKVLAATNTRLVDVQAALQRTDQRIAAANSLLETTNPTLTSLDGGLTHMRIIDDVNVSLKEVEKELLPLTKSMSMVSSAASFFGMGGSADADLTATEETPPTPPTPTTTTATTSTATPGSSPPTTPVTASTASTKTRETPADSTAAAAKRPDALAGTWVITYPAPAATQRMGKIVVIATDGGYLESQEGKPLATGHWKRNGRTVTIQIGEAGKGGTEETGELLAATPHALTLRFGDALRVYTRP